MSIYDFALITDVSRQIENRKNRGEWIRTTDLTVPNRALYPN